MAYIIIHLLSSITAIVLQSNKSDYMPLSLVVLYILTGPLGLIAELFTEIF